MNAFALPERDALEHLSGWQILGPGRFGVLRVKGWIEGPESVPYSPNPVLGPVVRDLSNQTNAVRNVTERWTVEHVSSDALTEMVERSTDVDVRLIAQLAALGAAPLGSLAMELSTHLKACRTREHRAETRAVYEREETMEIPPQTPAFLCPTFRLDRYALIVSACDFLTLDYTDGRRRIEPAKRRVSRQERALSVDGAVNDIKVHLRVGWLHVYTPIGFRWVDVPPPQPINPSLVQFIPDPEPCDRQVPERISLYEIVEHCRTLPKRLPR